ncbi:MAG: PAS domain S-box protein [Ardenticatenaceae bacterium]|nr:PAS domain S-box protein [Ardenticatenaceae bacterium]MCB8986440.1 PAS domain S-box protein [Ardenticatenaceae bacterium]
MSAEVIYYVLSFVVTAVTLALLWRQDTRQSRLRNALLGLLLVSAAGGGLAYWQPPGVLVYLLILQLLGWALFLWGAAVPRLAWGLGLLFLTIVALLPQLPGWQILSWGLLTAVPLAAYFTWHQSASPAIPIFAPAKMTPFQQPARVRGDVSSSAVQSQQPILECLTDGIVLSGVDGAITYVNEAAAAIIGKDTSALIGHPVTDILTHLPMLATASQAETELMGSPLDRNNFEINSRIINGRMTILYNHDGVVQGTVAILRDITTEFNAERSRDSFLTTVSHELRTPLTAIKGYAELLDSGAGGPLTETQKSFTQPIQRNVTRMVQLINSLIFAAAVRGGQMEFATDHTNVPQIINQIAREMTPKAATSGQQFIIQLDEHLGVIQADPMHIATILEELLANAIKYNKTGGKVHVYAGLQRDEGEQQEFVLISIRDEGIGIQPEDQTHIFDDFYHPDKMDAQVQAGGLGMGLSVVRALVEAYNGRVWLESTPGRGSTFFLLIPVHQSQTTSPWQND